MRCAVLPRDAFQELMNGRTAVAIGFGAVVRARADVRATNRRLVERKPPDESLSLQDLTGRLYGSS